MSERFYGSVATYLEVMRSAEAKTGVYEIVSWSENKDNGSAFNRVIK